MVASAAPLTPKLKTHTNKMSQTILIKQDATKKYKGLLESPTALKTPEPTL